MGSLAISGQSTPRRKQASMDGRHARRLLGRSELEDHLDGCRRSTPYGCISTTGNGRKNSPRRHGGTEAIMLMEEELSGKVIGAAIEVHKTLGPGLLESAYEECLCHELGLRGLSFARQVDLPILYKGVALSSEYR